MSQLKFTMKPIEEKRKGGYRSIYDPIIDEFIEKGSDLVEVTVEGKRASYVVTNLRKRIEVRGLDIEASSVGGVAYLEKKPPT
jgi:hypothetical protein